MSQLPLLRIIRYGLHQFAKSRWAQSGAPKEATLLLISGGRHDYCYIITCIYHDGYLSLNQFISYILACIPMARGASLLFKFTKRRKKYMLVKGAVIP